MITFTPAEAALRAYDLRVHEPLLRLRRDRRRWVRFLARHTADTLYPGSPRHLVVWPLARLGYNRHAPLPWAQRLALRLDRDEKFAHPRWAAMQRKVTQRLIDDAYRRTDAKMRDLDWRPPDADAILAKLQASAR